MQRTFGTRVCLDEEAVCKLNRLRRGSRQPLSRIVNTIVYDFIDAVCGERRPSQRTRRSLSRRRRA
jgi:hypothetical protein